MTRLHTRLAIRARARSAPEHKPGRRIPAIALVAGVMIALALPGVASAAKPVERFHDRFTDAFSDELCGIPVDVQLTVTDNFLLFADDTFADKSSVMVIYTNPENGKTVTVSSAGLVTGPPAVVDEEAGTITFITTFVGLPEKIQTLRGRVLLRDAGIISFADTFDLETGEFLGSEVTIKGPHPEAESDFEAFCEVIIPALT